MTLISGRLNPAPARNGLPEPRPYVYRGTGVDLLTPYLDGLPEPEPVPPGPPAVKTCGTQAAYRRHLRRGEPPCEDCKKASARDTQDRSRRRRCGDCGYLCSSLNHKTLCGSHQ